MGEVLESYDRGSYKIVKYVCDSESKKISLNEQLLDQLVGVARDGFGKDMSLNDIIDHIVPNSVVFVAYRDGVAVGFATSNYEQNNLYLVGAVIYRSEQNKGLYRLLTLLRLEDGLRDNIFSVTTRTQNPHVERGITWALEKLSYKRGISGYEIRREKLDNVYEGMLTSDKPLTSDSVTNEIYSNLDYERGDAYFITFNLRRSN